ncbi:hypothetical protein Tco_1458796 [Tanacetum coccineum]
MSSSTHPIIVPSDSNVEDAFSSTTTPDYTSRLLRSIFPAYGETLLLTLQMIYLRTSTFRDTHRGYTKFATDLIMEKMTPKRTSTSAALAMTQAAIRKLVADSVAVALEAQAATMENDDNTNRDT